MISQLGYRCRGFLVHSVQKSLLPFLVLLLFASLSPAATGAEETASGRTPPTDYRIGPEDTLEISVWREEDLQRQVLVRPDGKISFPLAGDIQAAGRTTEQVQQDISQRLQRYIPEPVVTVTVVTIGGKIYVIGQVNNPGAYVIGRYVDVLQALTLAGGLTPFASENNIKVLR
ncbi:MAG: polysaccharide biosynthesis/export family protein, partial [Gammaproteobacteria bacterium]